MNEYVLYQPCITSWSIVLFHPTNLSFSQRLINYGCDSVSNYDLIANQSTSCHGKTWLMVWPTHTHAHWASCGSYQQALCFWCLGSWESFLKVTITVPLGMVLVRGSAAINELVQPKISQPLLEWSHKEAVTVQNRLCNPFWLLYCKIIIVLFVKNKINGTHLSFANW